jgi:hypothetical protein
VTDDASAADAFFAERGFQLFVVKDMTEGDYSADLVSRDRAVRIQWRYGSGATPNEAAASAHRRYQTKEEQSTATSTASVVLTRRGARVFRSVTRALSPGPSRRCWLVSGAFVRRSCDARVSTSL